MIFERSPNTNGKVFKRYEGNKFEVLGYRTIKPWEATQNITYFTTILNNFAEFYTN